MSIKKTFAINGFGRIGRTTFRVWWDHYQQDLDLVAINTSGSMSLEGWVHLLKHDTNYGNFDPGISFQEHQSNKDVTDEDPVLGVITIQDKQITVTAQRDPNKLPWQKLGVELVLEATGVFLKEENASQHLTAGAKKVLLTAPAKGGNVSTSVLGVNQFDAEANIFSNASCTTNCVAPVVHVLNEKIGVEKATLTTIHAYTDTQNLLDNSDKKDLRRARAAAENLIPTSTGAAKATTKIIPQLEGLFDGLAVRVPIPTGSLSDIVFISSKDTSVEEVNSILTEAAQSDQYQGSLAVSNEHLVSSDIVGRNESSIVDLELTQVIGGNLVKVVVWYDNEWGYCARLLDQLALIPLD